MKAYSISIDSNLKNARCRVPGQQPREYHLTVSSVMRLMDLCNGDTVNVLHYIGLGGIGLEIHRNQPRLMPVSDPRSAAWKAGKDNKAAYPRFRRGPADIITTDRPYRYQDDHPSLTAGERNK